MLLVTAGFLFSLLTIVCGEDKKWVWKDNSRSAKDNNARYEIYEPEETGGGDYHGFMGNNNRPVPVDLGGSLGQRPIPGDRPGGSFGQRPGGSFGQRPGGTLGFIDDQYRPGLGGQGQGPGLGPGPVGEYPRPYPEGDAIPGRPRPPFKKFDTCTCSEKFNCKSPGIFYGHCDVGKSYCCYNKHGGLDVGPAPNRPIHSPENGVLVGPGAYDKPGYGGRPDFNGRPDYNGRPEYNSRPGYNGRPDFIDRPSFNDRPGFIGRPSYGRPGARPPSRDPGILVGPGGPTGVIGRPIGGHRGRPFHSAENGILVGPGGPYDRPYGRPYLRSASGDSNKAKD